MHTHIGSILLESMSSTKEEIVPPTSGSQQAHNKYFPNRMPIHTISPDERPESGELTTPATVIHVNKYFASNMSSISNVRPTSIDDGLPSTISANKAHSRHRNGTHKSTNATSSSSASSASSMSVSSASLPKANRTTATHFQIGQKQLVLAKNMHTEPPPKMNDILESLSVSSSKHLHHDHRYVFAREWWLLEQR